MDTIASYHGLLLWRMINYHLTQIGLVYQHSKLDNFAEAMASHRSPSDQRVRLFFFIRPMIKGIWLDAVFRADYESDLENKLKLNFHSEGSTLQHFQLLSLLFRLGNPFKKYWKLSYRIENRILYNMAYFVSCLNEKVFFTFLKNVLILILCSFNLIWKLNFWLHWVEGTWNYLFMCKLELIH
jgi:hypothetical protein